MKLKKKYFVYLFSEYNFSNWPYSLKVLQSEVYSQFGCCSVSVVAETIRIYMCV